ncbi:MAG TPA: DEAD/DEAH box helicase, partial [Streptosporangiaceae bacterium]|nr:DEAD/DEAH box helicase [Streptosporangiaceae bacterium]
ALGVAADVVAVLAEDGITTPRPIQAAVLPDALAGLDILGRAQTGSGKTLGFSLPLVARLAGGHTMACRPRGLVLVPTRELAIQVQAVLSPLAAAMGLTVTAIFGGTPQRPQVAALRNRADIVVACPGRLADLIGQGHCHLGDVEVSVLDEADQMADLGFLPVVRQLLEATPAEGQRLLFSATLDREVDVLARRFLARPARHDVDAAAPPAQITHHLLTVTPADRAGVVAALASGEARVLIFTRTKHGARKLARQLTMAGIPAAELHGDLAQGARSRNLAAFGSGEVRAMVATDIAARGLHVDGIGLVIHADPPAGHKAYVHRSGRTARSGAAGTVVTVQTAAQAAGVRALMRQAGVMPRAAAAGPRSAVLRSIAGPPARRTAPVARLARPAPAATQATGRGAVAASGSFRSRRKPGRRG